MTTKIRTQSRGAATMACAILAGCSSGAGGPGAGPGPTGPDRTGVGSASLRIEASVSADPSTGEEAASASGLDTHFEIDVRDASGADVSGATVIVDSALGAVTLAESSGCGRRYCGRQLGYAPTYELSVTRGADYVDDVRFTGPGFHRVTAPAAGSTVDATMPLTVSWSASGDASSTTFETRETSVDLAGDAGTYSIPPGTLRTRDDRPEDERIRVRRRDRLVLTGALPGSDLGISVRNGLELFTQVTP